MTSLEADLEKIEIHQIGITQGQDPTLRFPATFLACLSTLAFTFGLLPHADTAEVLTATDSLRHQVLTTWTTDQGLPQNFVRAITQTSDGFVWIGTMNGLTRFDGLHFRNFSKDGPAEIQDNIVALAPDSERGLWIASATSLFHYTDQQFRPVSLRGSTHYQIENMIHAQDGGIWLFAGGNLFRSHQDSFEEHALPEAMHSVRDMAETKDGSLWLADGESVVSIGRASKVKRFPLAGVRMLYVDSFNDLFAGDGHKLFRFDGHGFVLVANPGLGNFVSTLVDHRHRLWMASGGLHGLSCKENGHIEQLTMADGLASNDVRLIFEDRSHDVWLGTISGLQRLHQGAFTTFTALDGLPGANSQFESIYAQQDHIQHSNDTIWIGTLEGGLASFHDGKWRQLPKAASPPAGQVRGFFADGEYPGVAIADYGIFSYRNGRYTKLPPVPHGYPGTPMRTADGSLWFSIDHRGLFRRKGHQLTHFGVPDGLPDETIWSISLGPDSTGDGSAWQDQTIMVGVGNQLMRWNQHRFETVLRSPSPVLSPVWLKRGGIAAGTLNGLVLRNGGDVRMMTHKEGLPGSTVLDVIDDQDGNLWLATARAIARLSRDQWTAYANHKIDHVEPEIFTQNDGLKSNSVLPLNEITAAHGEDGRIWFATPRGVSVVDPRIAPEPPIPAVVDSILVDDQMQPARDLTIGPGEHRITFLYTTPPSLAPDQTRFRYRLTGWDNRWIDAGTERQVSYTALKPGSYTFEVIAISRENIVSTTSAAIHLRLKPYFWQTTWFLIVSLLTGAAIIAEVTRRRTRINAERLNLRFQERAAERERIAYQIHDTVIQDMIGTALQLELLGFQITDRPETANSMLDKIAHRLRETIARSRNMVWSLHSTAVVQYSLVEVLRYAEAEFRLGELPVFALTSTGEPRDLHPLIRDEVYRICREALANAFRHSNAQSVQVIVRFLPDVLEVEISDDGQGIDEEIRLHGRPGHFGLPGMQAHAKRIGAVIRIISLPGQGTTIFLRVRTREQRWPWFKIRFWRPHRSAELAKGRPDDSDHAGT